MTETSEEPPPPPPLSPWRYSKTKKQLIKDIKDGNIDWMPPKEVHAFRPEYEKRPYTNFRNNLKNLRDSLHMFIGLADEDEAALLHDEALNLRKNSKPYPRWHGSEAEGLLKVDIDNGLYVPKKARELHNSREEYQEFPLEVFRGHIHQENRSRRERPYWLARRAEQEKAKAAKAAKKAARKEAAKQKKAAKEKEEAKKK